MRFALLAAALVAAMPSPAKACSPMTTCGLNQFVPADGATVPANLPAILWWRSGADAAMIELHDDAGAVVSLTDMGQGVLVPATPLVAGKTYTLVDHNACSDVAMVESSFTTTAEAPLPTALGTLVATDSDPGPFTVAMPASCTTDVTADREGLALTLDASALPWKDALLFRTQLDGGGWTALGAYNQIVPPGSSWIGRGVDVIYTVCSALPDGAPHFATTEGAHGATMLASLANTSLSVSSSTAQFSLDCTATGPTTGGDDGGGGCSTAGGTGVAAMLGLLALRRRRRR